MLRAAARAPILERTPATRFRPSGIQCPGPRGTRSSMRYDPIRVAFARTGCSNPSIAISTVKPALSRSSTSGVDDSQSRFREVDIRRPSTRFSSGLEAAPDPQRPSTHTLSTSSANTAAKSTAARAFTRGLSAGQVLSTSRTQANREPRRVAGRRSRRQCPQPGAGFGGETPTTRPIQPARGCVRCRRLHRRCSPM